MTGFGNAVVECENKKYTVDIKSVNSKQLDFSARIPQAYRQVEAAVRSIVAATLERGKCELTLNVETLTGDTAVDFNLPALHAYKEKILEMSRELQIPEPQDWYAVLLRFPDSMKTEGTASISDTEREGALQAVVKAVEALMDYRRAEGRRLEEFFSERIKRIGKLLDEVPRYETERVAKIRTRIEENLAAIPNVEYDKGRLEQEMIFYIEKLDINEEKQRLRQHLDYFTETMADSKPGQGKKLGFISQEMGREINTLGSKSNQAEMQMLVVRMKDELEQIKEQVLNVM